MKYLAISATGGLVVSHDLKNADRVRDYVSLATDDQDAADFAKDWADCACDGDVLEVRGFVAFVVKVSDHAKTP